MGHCFNVLYNLGQFLELVGADSFKLWGICDTAKESVEPLLLNPATESDTLVEGVLTDELPGLIQLWVRQGA